MSPRPPDYVGLLEIRDLLTAMGKVNQKTGEPLNVDRVAHLLNRDDFPRPVRGDRLRRNRLWQRSAVVRWAETWEQREGRPPKQRSG